MPTDQLLEGFRRFRRTTFLREQGRYRRAAINGQRPKVLLIACADSRVSPSVIFRARPGDIFIVRNVANIVPAYDPDPGPRSIGAAVEYAIKVLGVTDIVIKGHARCGGVAALVDGARHLPPTDYLMAWVEVAAPARALFPPNFESLSPDEQRLAAEQSVIQNSVINLSGYPWVRERLDNGTLRIHGWHFDILTGALTCHDAESGEWVGVD